MTKILELRNFETCEQKMGARKKERESRKSYLTVGSKGNNKRENRQVNIARGGLRTVVEAGKNEGGQRKC